MPRTCVDWNYLFDIGCASDGDKKQEANKESDSKNHPERANLFMHNSESTISIPGGYTVICQFVIRHYQSDKADKWKSDAKTASPNLETS